MELGPMRNFIYIIGDPSTREIAVVDPGWDVDMIRQEEKKHNYRIQSILLTHGHYDHMQGVNDLLATHDVPVYISAHEPDYYAPQCSNIQRFTHDQIIRVGRISIRCLHTPGHTPGSSCFLSGLVLLTGDTLFIGGRCDFPGGDAKALYHSLYDVILKLPGQTVIYPGHYYGPALSMKLEDIQKVNPYLNCPDEVTFVGGCM